MFISLHRYFVTKKLLLLLARNTYISPCAQENENDFVFAVAYGKYSSATSISWLEIGLW